MRQSIKAQKALKGLVDRLHSTTGEHYTITVSSSSGAICATSLKDLHSKQITFDASIKAMGYQLLPTIEFSNIIEKIKTGW
jgi:hypothetical protein